MTKSILKSFLVSIFFFSIGLSQEQFSISFSGNSHVSIPSNLLDHDEPRTILAQVKNNGGGTIYSNFTSETGEYSLGVWSNGSMFQLKGSNGNWVYAGDATTTVNGEWMYVVAVWDLNQVKLYENDILVGVTDLQGSLAQNTFNGSAGIGVSAANWNGWYNGKISEVAVWNRALNEQEIFAIINGASVTNEYENLIAYWPFNEGSGNVINDVSGNNNHATLSNGEWSTDVPPIPPVIGGNNSLIFDGVDDYVDTGLHGGDLTNGFSYAIDFKVVGNDQGALITKYNHPVMGGIVNAISLQVNPDGNLYNMVRTESGSIEFATDLFVRDGEWHSVQYTFDNYQDKISIWLDGNLHEYPVNNLEGSIYDESKTFWIGRHTHPQYPTYFKGLIDNVKIWSSPKYDFSSNNDLMLHYSFDDGQGSTVTDFGLYGGSGTIYGATWTGDASNPGCTDPYANNFSSDANVDDGSCNYPESGDFSLQFDGVDDYIRMDASQLDNIFKGYNPFTISTWLKRSNEQSVNDHLNVFSKGTTPNSEGTNPRGVMILTHVSGDITFILYSAPYDFIYVSANNFLTTDSWDHISATYDGGTSPESLKLYKNGSLHENVSYGSNGNYTGIVATDGQPTVLGARLMDNGNTHLPFIGNINDLSIWSESLSGDQIQNIYANNYENENTLVGKWNFSEGEGQLLYDRTGNANHATINGPTWSEDVYVPPAPPVIGGNNSLIFDGVDDLVQLNQDAFTGQTATLMAWFNPKLNLENAFDSGKPIYCQGASTTTYATFGVGLRPNSIWLEMGAPGNQIELTNNSFTYDSWNHIAVSFDNGLVNTYVNGSIVSTVQAPYSTISNNGQGAFIGRRGNTSNVDESYSFQGMISHFSSVPYVLSHNDIYQSMINDGVYFDGSYWNFNEGQNNTLNDLGSHSNHGTINGATWTGDAPKVGCMDPYADNYDPEANVNSRFCYGYPENGDHSLSFVSNQDHVDFGNNMDSDDKFSITTWVYIDESIIPLNGQRTFINKVNSDNGNKSIFLGSYQSKIGFTVLTGQQSNIMYGSDNQNGSLALTQTPLVSGWQHVGAVFTGDSMLVYINGILDQNVVVFDGPGSVNDYENSVWHMADVLGGSGNVGGKISEMNLWNTALKQNQIQQLMYESPDNLSAGLMGSWKFSEGDGDLLYDHSGNGNHGSILGATWNSDVPYIGPEWFVSTDGDDSNIGSLEQPFLTIQKAINSAGDGHLVSVSPGTYYENINYNGKNILIISEVGPDQTTIDGGQNGSVVTFNTNETDGAAIDGFTITNGYTDENGGGIFIDGASPGIYNVIVENNYANSGGGIDLKGESNSIISNSIVRNNLAEWGAGIYFHSNSPTVENVVVSGNHATTNAGGVYARDNSFPVITNCTIVNNSTDGEGGGILTWFNSLVDVKNSIIRDNYPTEIGHVTGGAVNLNYSNISTNHQGFTGSNNINEDPMFCNQSNDDFRLAQDSPCMGTGEFGNDIGVMFDGEYCEQSFVNNSLSFNGNGDYVIIEDADILSPSDLTVELFIKQPTLSSGRNKYISKSDGNSGLEYQISQDVSPYGLTGIVAQPPGNSNNFLQTYRAPVSYKWNHLAFTYNSSTDSSEFFLNGQTIGKKYINGTIQNTDGSLVIGSYAPYTGINPTPSYDDFKGLIDEIRISSNVRYTESFTLPSNEFISDENTIALYNFNEGQGTILNDLSGNGNNGTIYGASWNNYGAPIISSNDDNNEPDINANLTGIISNSIDETNLEGAHIIAISEDNSFTAETFSDENGSYSLGLVGSLNYFVNISFDGLIDHDEYLYIGPFEDTYLNVSLDLLEDALVEGTVTDWYTNAPLENASVLLAYTDEEMITIESTTDENGYFMVQVPGEEDYDLFVYSDGYWVEHDAFYLSSGEHQVLNVGIAEMSAASRLYGTVRDFDTDELIPYAEIQLNCEQASDWDHTGELGTYRVFNYYPGDCDDGVLVVTANGYETSVQSVGNIEFEAGSSYDLDIALVQGNDPDPGMLSGTVYSNIDGNVVDGAEVVAYNVNTTQLFSIETSDDGYYQLFLPESEYYISINAPYHEELLDTLSIISGQSFTMDFNLDQVIEYKISGVVSDQNGNPLSGFETFVTRGNGYRTTYTNENGEYELFVPNGTYDVGSGSNNYLLNLVSGVEVQDNDIVLDFVLESIQEFDGGFAGTVHLNDGDMTSVQINVWDNNSTYNAYVSSDDNGAFALPLVNGTYTIYAWVPNSDYESIYIPNAFTVDNNVVSYDLYFIAPDGPEAPTIVLLEDVPNDQGGQLELAWTPGEPREYEIFPQYSVWRMDGEWNLVATVPYHGFDLYNMVVPTLGDSTSDGIFESMFMVTAHTLDQNTFFDSNPLTGYSIDNIFPAIPQQLMASVEGEIVELNWDISSDEDFSYYNVYRQDQSSLEAATIFETENNNYSDNIDIDGDYQYWVTAVDVNGNESDPSEPAMVTLGVQEDLMPMEFALMQNYPNPFNPSTQIMYSLPKTSLVKIVIYDMLGSKVRTLYSGVQDAGYKNVLWNATNETGDPVSAGMYIYTIEAGSFFASKKMILLK